MEMLFRGIWMGPDMPRDLQEWLETVGLGDPELFLATFRDNDFQKSWDDAVEAAALGTNMSQGEVARWLHELTDRADGKTSLSLTAATNASELDLTAVGIGCKK